MNSPDEEQLWHAALTGQYTPGTGAATLATYQNSQGFTALHEAAFRGTLPPDATIQLLVQCKDHFGVSPLHLAAQSGHYPSYVTTRDLLHNTANDGNTAMHWAARSGNLLPDTTPQDLHQTKNKKGQTPWDLLLLFTEEFPTKAIQLSPTFFHNHPNIALTIAQSAIKANQSLAATAAIWLSHVIAKSHQHHNSAIPQQTV